jgi:acyl transferase domain-containing protein/thioesterase domain-containing protein
MDRSQVKFTVNDAENSSAGPLIAVVGMAGRFPGARNLTEFWRNLRSGVESISRLSDEQLIDAGVTAAELGNSDYVKAAAILEDIDRFDANFFGLSPRDAAIMDPQHRHFLECAWEALDNAGWSPDEFTGRVGVYAGSGMNSYLINNLLANPELVASAGLFLLKQTGNDKDVLASRVSYQLNLTGPSLAVQTACSTSLVAIHLACQSLLSHECDMALAGGVTIEIPHGRGYLYREGEILSRDGHCRSFDAASSGTIFGSGLGIVVLRRLEDATRDGDLIHAVIRGTAINNDGARKVGYLAPSVAGQADAIAEALTVADTEADSISYVETHGTGTAVGDPIEIAALTRAFRTSTERNGFCAIGSLKTNIGHLDAAAGVAGFIKTVLALEHRELPPSLNFSQPNPLIDFDHSPFYVNTKLRAWESDGQPRRAGVTSLGIGGTNAHAILEEAPPATPSGPARPWQLLTLSAKTPAALEAMAGNLADHVEEKSPNLGDAAFTGHFGRKAFRLRRAVICSDSSDAVEALRGSDPKRVLANFASENDPPVIFLCSGQGSQYLLMGRGLYESEPEFRSVIDFCADYLYQFIGIDLRTILFPPDTETSSATELLDQTRLTQPALFVIEYALAKLWASWGIKPAAMIGHSVGELAAACIAGVFSLEAGLQIIAERGRLMQSLPSGSMTAVPLPENQVIPLLNGKLSLASVNGDGQCVVSGPDQAIGGLEKSLAGTGVQYNRLRVSHAFHSSMMDPILRGFADFVRKFELSPPRIPYISSATGSWITDGEATDPDYWARQLRQTVRFSDGIARALETPGAIFLEVGPGNTLSALCEQHRDFSAGHIVISSLRVRRDNTSDQEFIVRALGQLWTAGKKIDWKGFHAHEIRRRLPLPTYPFQRERFWIEPGRKIASVVDSHEEPLKDREPGFFRSSWKREDLSRKEIAQSQGPWLIFEDQQGVGARIIQVLQRRGEQYFAVQPGPKFARLASVRFEIDPDNPTDYQRLLSEIAAQGNLPRTIVHLWSVCAPGAGRDSLGELSVRETMSFYSLLFLGQALGAMDLAATVQIAVVSNSLHQVAKEPVLAPGRALLAGPCAVIPKELANVRCQNIDVEIHGSPSSGDDVTETITEAATQILAELRTQSVDSPVAYRRNRRWIQTFAKCRATDSKPAMVLRDQGVYLITGGLGGIGLVLAESIAKTIRARLVLISRRTFPPKETWEEWSTSHHRDDATSQKIRTIREIESLGTEVMVGTADVCDEETMKQAANQVRARFGPINGIIHAAGVLNDMPLLQKDRTSAARVLGPKVRGALVLESVFRHDPVDFFFLMSSVSSQVAPAGQIDYVAANAFLNAFATSRSSSGSRCVSIQWPRWTDTGMAAELDGYSELKPIHPLLGHAEHESDDTTYSTSLSLETDWIVNEHRLSGGPGLFPATGYLEMVRAAVADLTGTSECLISNFVVNQPLKVEAHSRQPVCLSMHKEGETYRFSARTIVNDSVQWVECAGGEVTTAAQASGSRYDIESLRRRCDLGNLGGESSARNEAQERHIEFGPRWRNLERIWLGRNEALSLLQLPPEYMTEVGTYRLHPALLDMATGSAMFLIKGNETAGYLYVPISYGRVYVSGQLPSTCYAYIRSKAGASVENPVATFDVTILDREGNAIVEISDFSVRQVRDLSLLDTAKSPVDLTDRGMIPRMDAISSEEGSRAFARILAIPDVSNVIVFPSDFSEFRERSIPQYNSAPSISSAAVLSAGRDDVVELTLIRWWKELLGVESVNSRASFFDLGGNSLTGVRLLAQVKRKYGVELQLATLFTAPTIEKLSALVRRQTEPSSFSFLIPIQPNGTKPPLYVIHGIGGSVLSFRELIKHLDADQPIYGVEYSISKVSPALLRMEDLAAHYLEEIRRLQPNGPYHLLGYSFGGLLAFEIAQQLTAAGQQVELLGMVDTFLMNEVRAAGLKRSVYARLKRRAAGLGRHTRRFVFGPGRRAYLREDLGQRFHEIVGEFRQSIYAFLDARGRPIPKFLERAQDVNWFAALRYEALPYSGSITLFRAATAEGFADLSHDRELGWGPLAQGGVAVHEIPGTHSDMMREPNVRILAREVNGTLRDHQSADPDLLFSKRAAARPASASLVVVGIDEKVTARNRRTHAAPVQ